MSLSHRPPCPHYVGSPIVRKENLMNSNSFVDIGDRARRNALKSRTRNVWFISTLLFVSLVLSLSTFILPLPTNDTHSAVSSNVLASGALAIFVVLLNAVAFLLLQSSQRIAAPLALNDPSIPRLKSVFYVTALASLSFFISITLIVPSLELSIKQSTAPLILSMNLLLLLLSSGWTLKCIIGSMREAKKFYNNARGSVVKGLNRMSTDLKRMSSFDFVRYRRGDVEGDYASGDGKVVSAPTPILRIPERKLEAAIKE